MKKQEAKHNAARTVVEKRGGRHDNINIAVTELEKKAFAEAASRTGLSLTAWCRYRLRIDTETALETAGIPVAYLAE